MAGKPSSKGPNPQASRSKDARRQKRILDEQEIQSLEVDSQNFTRSKDFSKFDQLPLSTRTKKGLKQAGFTDMTDIQLKSLPISLSKKDILGAARTGSGKTLAFLIPILEILYRNKWGPSDGLGALVLSPTRELALQIFSVLRSIGGFHTFSAGLVIGGKGGSNDVDQEAARLSRMNIIIATPGRLLQHLDQTIGFDVSNLQMLVLDEADRILDMGFSKTLDAILENLPKSSGSGNTNGRQTLLFSATQTKKVGDLARLSLKDPEYVSVREKSLVQNLEVQGAGKTGDSTSTTDLDNDTNPIPSNLSQHYLTIPLPSKLSLLFSFLRTHVKSKILIFFSSCRQVQFVTSVFSKLQPGIPISCLHGKQKQPTRLKVFQDFSKSKFSALIATDIAARGLDFSSIDWVIQVDAPDDFETYVHRVGRTARAGKKGNSLLFLTPNEESPLVQDLEKHGIKMEKIKQKESKMMDLKNQLQSLAFKETEIKHLAQKAFVSYVRSIHLQKNKKIFDVTELPLEEFAASLGLPGAPKVKFVKEAKKAKKDAMYKEKKAELTRVKEERKRLAKGQAENDVENDEDDANESEGEGPEKVKTKYDRMFNRQNQGVLSEHWTRLIEKDEGRNGSDSDSERSNSDSDSDLRNQQDDDDDDGIRKGGKTSRLIGGKDSDDSDSDSGDDFLKISRRDHDLDEDEEGGLNPSGGGRGGEIDKSDYLTPNSSGNLSKRKLQQGTSKKASALSGMRGSGKRTVFDEDGNEREAWEIGNEDQFKEEVKKAAAASSANHDDEKEGELDRGLIAENALARKWAREEAERLQLRDVQDKEREKEKKRERKNKEKAKERDERDAREGTRRKSKLQQDQDGDEMDYNSEEEDALGATIAPLDDRDDGYETPDFILPSEDDEDDEDEDEGEEIEIHRPNHTSSKKRRADHSEDKSSNSSKKKKVKSNEVDDPIPNDEELALRLLTS